MTEKASLQFSDREQLLLQTLLADLLPAVPDSGFPAGCAQALIRHVGSDPPATQCLHTFLDTLQATCSGLAYPDRPVTERLNLLATMKRGHLRLFSDFFITAVQAYCLDPRVHLALGEQFRAPFPDGHQVADGSFDLLETVYLRGPFHRSC